jgi:hypothetical protein
MKMQMFQDIPSNLCGFLSIPFQKSHNVFCIHKGALMLKLDFLKNQAQVCHAAGHDFFVQIRFHGYHKMNDEQFFLDFKDICLPKKFEKYTFL